MNIVLWIVQALLALMFIVAGGFKTFLPLDALKKNLPWTNHVPAWLVRFIGIAELLGGIGLILPDATKILPWLTIAAAIGLALIMIGAAVYHAARREFSSIAITIVLLLLALLVVVGRIAWVPVA